MYTKPPVQDWRDDPITPRRGRLAAVLIAVAMLVLCAAVFLVMTGSTPPASGPVTPLGAAVDPELVDVTATLSYQSAVSMGTGMVLTSTGRVLTNNHVIEGATSITVTDVGNQHTYRAAVTGYDATHDIAVLQLAGASGLRTVPLGNSATLRTGEQVTALGNAGGAGGTPSAAAGTISGLNQSIEANDQAADISEQLTGLIQTSAPIQQGDSGGPLVNAAGQVIGMTTAASAQYQFATTVAQGFAIPISQALAIATQIASGKTSATIHIGPTAFLGIEVVPYTVQVPGNPADAGAGVADTTSGSPAAAIGLSDGDVITSIGGHGITSAASVRSVLETYQPGDRVTIGWTDPSGQSRSATAVLTSGPAG